MPVPPTCEQCQQEMVRDHGRRGASPAAVGAGVGLFAVGLILSFVAWPASFVVGPLVIVVALLVAGIRPRLWRCEQCGATQKRAGHV